MNTLLIVVIIIGFIIIKKNKNDLFAPKYYIEQINRKKNIRNDFNIINKDMSYEDINLVNNNVSFSSVKIESVSKVNERFLNKETSFQQNESSRNSDYFINRMKRRGSIRI